ncbi:MAG: site-specific integrase, partial [Arenicella sp.]|nr:site-specific integrase [Arenicella sp.]
FDFIKNKPINKISADDIDSWRESRRKDITFSTMKRTFTCLKACLNTALKHYKLIDKFELQTYTLKRKPNEKVNPPKLRFLLDDEESKLLKALENRDQELREKRARYVEWQSKRKHSKRHVELFSESDYPDHITPIVMLAYHTGFDLGDLFDLNWELHIDFENNQIQKVRNKTSHKQDNPQPVVVPMTSIVKEVLEQWGRQYGMAGRVFKSPKKGGRFDNITTAWTSIKTKAGLDNFRFKDFRHTFGSRLAIAGVDILVIRDLMGHTDVKTTQIYAHLCPKQKTDAVLAAFS